MVGGILRQGHSRMKNLETRTKNILQLYTIYIYLHYLQVWLFRRDNE